MVLKWVKVYRVGIKSWGKEEDEVFRGVSRGILRQGNKRDIILIKCLTKKITIIFRKLL